MHRLNWVTVVLILLTGIFYFVLLSNRYTLGKNWEKKIAGLEEQIRGRTADIEKLREEIYGIPLRSGEEWTWNRMGLIARNDKLNSLVPGKVWTNCCPETIATAQDAAEMELTFSIDRSEGGVRGGSDSSFGASDLVYVFDKGVPFVSSAPEPAESAESAAPPAPAEPATDASSAERPKFLGAFTITAINPAETTVLYSIRSIGVVEGSQRELITESVQARRAWIVYEGVLPTDSPNDIACWLEEYPDSPFSKTLSEEEREFFKKTVYGSVDDLEEVSAALAEAKDDSSLHLFAEPPAGKRYPDRYDTRLLRGYYQRDKLTVLTARGESSRNDLDHVICDQLAMIGCDTVPGTEQGDSDTDLPEKFNGLDEKDRSEFHEKSAALLDAYRAIGEDGLSRIESLLPSAKNGFASQTFFDQKREAAEKLQTMEHQRDIVQERLVIARESLEQVQDRIDFLTDENARLARLIAGAQFEASDAIMERAASMAATSP